LQPPSGGHPNDWSEGLRYAACGGVMAKRPRNASGAGATFEIRPLAHMLIQPDFSCFFSETVAYTTPKGTLPLCCRTPATHPSISRFGPPRGLLIQPDFSCFFTNPETYTTPEGHCPLCCRTPATHPSISRFGPPPRARRATQLWFCKFRLREATTPACLSDIK
jgi:hypothetical protein